VVLIVGALGIVIRPHQPAVWPFDHTLSFDPVEESAWMQLAVAVSGAVACIAAITLLAGALGRPPRIRITAMAGVVIPAVVLVSLLAVPAGPTTYQASPVPYAAEAVTTGSALYAANCSICHVHDASDVSAVGLSPPDLRLNLNERVPERREGELFWSIAEGIPGTLMPGFGGQLSEVEIWSLVQFLDAQAAAQNALALSDGLKPSRPVPAPDFTYEFAGRPQESLRQLRGSRVALLVFYTMPSSLARLRELAALESDYTAAGAAVIAMEMPASPASTSPDLGGSGESLLAFVSPAVASTYLMFARLDENAGGGAPTHVEYLVDRFGYIRVRRIGVPEANSSDSGEMLRQIELLVREPPREELQWGHRH
jgi:putative copper resistance protein D